MAKVTETLELQFPLNAVLWYENAEEFHRDFVSLVIRLENLLGDC